MIEGFMSPKVVRLLPLAVLSAFLLSSISAVAQRERQIQGPPDQPQGNNQQYGRRFFLQLRAVFGRFRDADLQRVFDKAQPIQCSELVNEKGEWRTVAFFNEKRELGDWYRSNFEEVKADLSVYVFKGVCRGEHGPVQLTSKFPVSESVDAYEHGKIPLEDVEVNVNAPVSAFYDPRSQAYAFDLPYLFLISHQENETLYSLQPPSLVDRERYARDVVDHWECKSVSDDAVTYQFLICRSSTVPRDIGLRNLNRTPAFGASAYFILSDGREASSSVKLSFGDANDSSHPVEDASVPATPETPAPAQWEVPDADEKLLDLVRNEFRVRFSPQSWNSKIGAAQVLAAQRMTSLESSNATPGADYCLWLPGAPAVRSLLSNEPADGSVVYSLAPHDQDSQSSTTITFNFATPSGEHLGTLKCVFPHVASAMSVGYGRWTSVVGDLLKFEIRP
jgi:hypothetical protein